MTSGMMTGVKQCPAGSLLKGSTGERQSEGGGSLGGDSGDSSAMCGNAANHSPIINYKFKYVRITLNYDTFEYIIIK